MLLGIGQELLPIVIRSGLEVEEKGNNFFHQFISRKSSDYAWCWCFLGATMGLMEGQQAPLV